MTTSLVDSIPDVETTNWNAVKLLATKYGIQLRSLDEIKIARITSRVQDASLGDGQDVTPAVEGQDGSEEDVEDLGIGTPFMITARAVEGGRVIYRFKWRGGDGVGADWRDESADQEALDKSSDTGYDPGSDSPSSSYGKAGGKKKQTSSRTLKTPRSVIGLKNMGSFGNLISASKSGQNERKRELSAESTVAQQAPQKIQRGDVLGAILGLREGKAAEDDSWIEGRRDINSADKGKSGKGKERDGKMRNWNHRRDLHADWHPISPFGKPVLKKNLDHVSMNSTNWQRSPIPRLTDLGSPLFGDNNIAFHATTPSLVTTRTPVEIGNESIHIFDILQRYTQKGVEPLEEEFVSASSSPIIRARQTSSSSDLLNMSEGTEDQTDPTSFVSAAPGDDPRFALWAIRSSDDDDVLILSSRDGIIDHVPPSPISSHANAATTPHSPTSGRRWSVRGPSSTSSSLDHLASATPPPLPQHSSKHSMMYPSDGAFLLAASTSCLVAELTSRIDSRFLTDFFYTYRAYLSSRELLRLLILRFKWAMSTATGRKDEARRKIVRVRTYTVLKYWLTNFFEIDFVPDRELRKQLTNWLNETGQDPNTPDVSIIKSLKKIVRGVKVIYEQGGVGGILNQSSSQSPDITKPKDFYEDANEVTKAFPQQSDTANKDSSPVPASRSNDEMTASGATNSHGHRNTANNGPATPLHNPPPPLPLSQNTISRVFVNTVGKLSRLKRNLNSRAANSLGNTTDGNGYEGLEFEANDSGDLLFIRGGLENFLQFFNMHVSSDQKSQVSDEDPTSDSLTGREETPSLSATSNQSSSTPASSIDMHGDSIRGSIYQGGSDAESEYGLGIYKDEDIEQNINDEHPDFARDESLYLPKSRVVKSAKADHLHHFQSDQTLRSVSTAQQPTTQDSATLLTNATLLTGKQVSPLHTRPSPSFSNRPRNNIVQIDDIDLSSDEDDGMVRRALRRLPGARDLRMAQHVHDLEMPDDRKTSFDSVSITSFGKVYAASQRSINPYYQRAGSMDDSGESHFATPPPPLQVEATRKIGIVHTEMFDPDEALQGYELVKGFRLDQLDSDDEEPGDVEAALRRLEGFIDQDKQKEKARRVEAMWLRSQTQRQEEEREQEARAAEEQSSSRQSAPSVQQTSIVEGNESKDSCHREQKMSTGNSAPSLAPARPVKERSLTQRGLFSSSAQQIMAKSAASKHQKGDHGMLSALSPPPLPPPPAPPRLWVSPPAPVHHSFLLNYRSEVIAQQFCLIESELFRAVTWREVVSDDWKQKQSTGQVLDWESFYQSKVRRKVEAQKSSEGTMDTSDLFDVEAIIARFNLTCNWVASEVVLTRHVDERAAVICKLIRIAWKCYHHSNFATLTQIILGLQSPWVERLSKTWSRIGMLEMRMLRDLKAFTNPARNFKYLRTSMRNMIVQGGMEELITSSGPPRSTKNNTDQSQSYPFRPNDGCIPFFGLFLSDLTVNNTLPTFIDATSPNSSVDYDAATGLLRSVKKPQAFAHLAPLPDHIVLSPLVNLYKFRITAITVKSILAFQDRLSAYQFQADANVYVKTLRIRCLEGEQLTQISHLVEP
ncbi:hypothetical protein CBS101457_002302 [Exobasidium rhododendri]|nr:hypothetical protein CBS101457_002302 [Exobasidium rhododendri]